MKISFQLDFLVSIKPEYWQAELGNSLFTFFLIKGLKGEADLNGDGVVTIKELYDYVYEATKEATGGAQHPQMEGRLLGAFPVSVTVNINVSLPPDSSHRPSIQPAKKETLKLGEYFVEGTNPNGTGYRGTASIARAGDGYQVTWEIGGQRHLGKGELSGSNIYVKWGDSLDALDRLVTYSIGEQGILKRVWADGKGTETLVPK